MSNPLEQLQHTCERHDYSPQCRLDQLKADPDLGNIGPGHVCKHGVRWPHGCVPCGADAMELARLKEQADEKVKRIALALARAYWTGMLHSFRQTTCSQTVIEHMIEAAAQADLQASSIWRSQARTILNL